MIWTGLFVTRLLGKEEEEMAGYKRAGPHKPTGGLGYFPHSPGADNATPEQFHAILESVIKQESTSEKLIPGLKAALALFQGYFGYFGESKEE